MTKLWIAASSYSLGISQIHYSVLFSGGRFVKRDMQKGENATVQRGGGTNGKDPAFPLQCQF